VLKCDYDSGRHMLHNAIQKKRWAQVERIFLDSETIEDRTCNEIKSRAEMWAKTWVYRRDQKTGSLKWMITPLHAAVIFGAPPDAFQKLLWAYPRAARARDDQGNLPLHLAYKNGISKENLRLLLNAYPNGIYVKNRVGLYPQQCTPASMKERADQARADQARADKARALRDGTSMTTRQSKNKLKVLAEGMQEVASVSGRTLSTVSSTVSENMKEVTSKSDMSFTTVAEVKNIVTERIEDAVSVSEEKLHGFIDDIEEQLFPGSTTRRNEDFLRESPTMDTLGESPTMDTIEESPTMDMLRNSRTMETVYSDEMSVESLDNEATEAIQARESSETKDKKGEEETKRELCETDQKKVVGESNRNETEQKKVLDESGRELYKTDKKKFVSFDMDDEDGGSLLNEYSPGDEQRGGCCSVISDLTPLTCDMGRSLMTSLPTED